MDQEKRKKYAELFISMSQDFILQKITWETYKQNLRIITNNIYKEEPINED